MHQNLTVCGMGKLFPEFFHMDSGIVTADFLIYDQIKLHIITNRTSSVDYLYID